MAVVSADLADPKWECSDHVVDKVDSVCLVVSFVELKRTDACHVVDGGILKATDLLGAFSVERQKLDVHLDMLPRDLFVVAFRVHLANRFRPLRQRMR